jgi:bacterioferritin-associated ferredoxin
VIVCHCERVSSAIVEATIAAGATTADEVTRACRAGGRCGTCRVTVEALLEAVVGDLDLSAQPAA